MFDGLLRPLIDPPLNRLAHRLAQSGVTGNLMTACGLVAGLLGAIAIAAGQPFLGGLLFALNRLADGLDGPLARLKGASPWGGFFDIMADFVVYGAVPLAFAWASPAINALPAVALLFSFYLNGAAFLAFSALAAQAGLQTTAQGQKSIYYVAGLAEGAETILVFLLMAAFPAWFPVLAWGFAAVTMVSALFRCILAWTTFARRG